MIANTIAEVAIKGAYKKSREGLLRIIHLIYVNSP